MVNDETEVVLAKPQQKLLCSAKVVEDYKTLLDAYKLLQDKCETDTCIFQTEIMRLQKVTKNLTVEIGKRDELFKQAEANRLQELEDKRMKQEELNSLKKELEECKAEYEKRLTEAETKFSDMEKRYIEREGKICEEYESQLNKFCCFGNENETSKQTEGHKIELDCALERYKVLEGKYFALKQENERRQYKDEVKIRAIETRLAEANELISSLNAKKSSLTAENERCQRCLKSKDVELENLRRKSEQLTLSMINLRLESTKQESNRSSEILEICLNTDLKFKNLEKLLEQRENTIKDTEKKLEESQREVSEKVLEIEELKQQNILLKSEIKGIKPKLQFEISEDKKQLADLQSQRNKALQQLRNQRKNVQNLKCRSQKINELEALVRERDAELQKVKQRYKETLKQMQRTITTVECRLIRTSQQLTDLRPESQPVNV
uniref:Coiled-coil domain-containing protein n=1 Tax=Syphacia muris TaxID=451379 RepID=A0A0N5AV73_9BILA